MCPTLSMENDCPDVGIIVHPILRSTRKSTPKSASENLRPHGYLRLDGKLSHEHDHQGSRGNCFLIFTKNPGQNHELVPAARIAPIDM